MDFKYNDGGRSKYFAASKVSDCVTRAVAIATGNDYKQVYDIIASLCGYTPRNGVKKTDTKKVMKYFGGVWHPCMGVGTGCKTHLADNEVPMRGRVVCSCSKHVTCIVDGVINDTYDPSRNGTRCVYGYWVFSN